MNAPPDCENYEYFHHEFRALVHQIYTSGEGEGLEETLVKLREIRDQLDIWKDDVSSYLQCLEDLMYSGNRIDH